MTKPEFAPEIRDEIARECRKRIIDIDAVITAFLRASGHAGLVEALVEALEEARDDLKRHVGATHWRTDPQLFVRIDAALKAAGREGK